jgi:hypothetical protein
MARGLPEAAGLGTNSQLHSPSSPFRRDGGSSGQGPSPLHGARARGFALGGGVAGKWGAKGWSGGEGGKREQRTPLPVIGLCTNDDGGDESFGEVVR